MKTEFSKKLKKMQKQRKKGVLRITIDSILADDLIRFEFCVLNEGVEEFLYELDVWDEGYDVLGRGGTYEFELGIPLSWDTLKEGQVFLYGEFEIIGDEKDPKRFKYSPGSETFLRIDNIPKFRDEVRKIYSDLLRRRK